MSTKRVWLNLNTGEFSSSWEKGGKYDCDDDTLLMQARERHWKLLEYTCVNDEEFKFTDWMQIFTSLKRKES